MRVVGDARSEAWEALLQYAEALRSWNDPDDEHTVYQLRGMLDDVLEEAGLAQRGAETPHSHNAGGECFSCGEERPADECSQSKRACGHHCNHSWTHDECCFCGESMVEPAPSPASRSAASGPGEGT